MFLIQIALTAALVHIVARRQLLAALSLAAILTGRTKRFPVVTSLIAEGSYWTAIVAGLAGVWTAV